MNNMQIIALSVSQQFAHMGQLIGEFIRNQFYNVFGLCAGDTAEEIGKRAGAGDENQRSQGQGNDLDGLVIHHLSLFIR